MNFWPSIVPSGAPLFWCASLALACFKRGRKTVADFQILSYFPPRPLPALGTGRCFGANGVLAQLVERFNGIEEVSGSTPLYSTKANPLGLDSILK